MILTRRKTSQPKTLTNGTYIVIIELIQESISEGKNIVIFKFKCDKGQVSLTMPIDKSLHSLLCDLMLYFNIAEYRGLEQFIGGKLTIQIINNTLKYISK